MDPLYPSNAVTGGPVYEDPLREELVDPPRRATWAERGEFPRYAFYGGLAGGVLVLVAAFVGALFLSAMAAFGAPLRDFPEVPLFIGLWGLVTGGAILLAAIAVKERPDRAAVPGIAMVAGGVLSFFALGGFLLGGLLAIVAGVLAVAGSRSVFVTRAPRLRGHYAP